MSTPSSSRSRRPLWLVEGLDVAEQRRLVIVVVALALAAVGVVVSLIAPGIVPRTAGVGAAVGFAALLLGYAAAVAVDAADLTVRGPRHVRAAGAELVAVVPSEPTLDDAVPLARAVLDAREGDERILLGLAATGRSTGRVVAWTDELAVALAQQGVSVLTIDLASGRSTQPGLYEVLTEGRRIGTVAEIDEELLLARVTAGSDLRGALAGLPELAPRLPRDLDVLLVALPTAASREVVAAATALDHLLVVAERGVTARVDLIAALDALERSETPAQAILVDDRTVAHLTGPGTAGGAGWSADRPPPDAPAVDDATGAEVAGDDRVEEPTGDAAASEDDATSLRVETGPDAEEDADAGPPAWAVPPREHGRPPFEPDPEPGPATVPGPTGERGIRLVPAPEPPPEPASEESSGPDEPAPAPTSGHDGIVERRDVDVLGAARAEAASELLEHRDDPLEEPDEPRGADEHPGLAATAPGPDQHRRPNTVPSLASSWPAEHVGDEAELADDVAEDPSANGLLEDFADTDQLPQQRAEDVEPAQQDERAAADPVGAPEVDEQRLLAPEPTSVDPEEVDIDDDDEVLHTTAQLAILVDELEDREQRS
jgi:hypothetical protein